jgi:hypothetical protein
MKLKTFKKIFSMHSRVYKGTYLSFISLMIVKCSIVMCTYSIAGFSKSILTIFASFLLAQITIWPSLLIRIDRIQSRMYEIFLDNLRTIIPSLLIVSVGIATTDSIIIYSVSKETDLWYVILLFTVNCIISIAFISLHTYFYLTILKIEYITSTRKRHLQKRDEV